MRGRGLALGRALGALVATLVLVVGVPYLLVRLVGNPLPSEVPSVDEIRILLTQNGEGFTNFVLGSLAIIIWITWAQLVIALAVETAATIRQSETRRIRTAPGIQALAARLIAAMALATTLATAPILAPAVGALSFSDIVTAPAATTLVVDAGVAPSWPGQAQPAHRAVSAIQFSTEQVELLTVADHTDLWDLAEAAYGDGVSWKAIAQANAGSFDGLGSMITGETESVSPGTELRLPAPIDAGATMPFGSLVGEPTQSGSYTNGVVQVENDAPRSAVGPRGDTTLAPTDGALHVVQPGDSMWTVAEHEVEHRLGRSATEPEVATYWAQVVHANEDVPSGDVDLIHPGEELVMPGRTAPTATEDTVEETHDAAEGSAAEGDIAEGSAAEGSAAEGDIAEGEITEGSAAEGDAAEGSAAEGDIAEDSAISTLSGLDRPVDRLGSQLGPAPATLGTSQESSQVADQSDRADPAEVPSEDSPDDDRSATLPALGLTATGAALLCAGVISAIRRRRNLQRRTRPAGSAARPASSDAAAFEAAIAHASHELRESQRGVGWRLMPAATVAAMRAAGPLQLHADASGEIAAVASVCQDHEWSQRRLELGAEETDVAAIEALLAQPMAELKPVVPEAGEAVVPTTVIIGTDQHGEAVLLDLASVGTLDLVGDEGGIRRVARTAVLDLAVSDRADDLRVVAVQVGHELDLERVISVATYQEAHAHIMRSGHAGADSGTPVVVVSTMAPGDDRAVFQALRDLGALVIAPGIGGDSKIEIDNDQAMLVPSGTLVRLAALNNEDYRAVVELVETTSPMAIELVDDSHLVEDVIDVVSTPECPVEAGPIEVRILGPVEIAGADSFSSLKAVDVVAYLAFHRHGVDADQIKTWVWPAFEPPTDKAFANVMSRARTGLGTDEDGSPYLSRAGADKTYRLAAAVTTDFDRFRALVELAQAATETSSTLSLLRQAIELIRGVPFSGGAASSFSWADNHVRAQVEYTIDEAVHQCADLALEIGDLASARWAALKGHELVPGCEQCFRRRFLIAGAGKNRSELRRAMADLEASAMVDLGEPEAVDMISGDLLELYHEVDKALVSGST